MKFSGLFSLLKTESGFKNEEKVMGAHEPVKADPKEIKRAEETWAAFTNLTKWSIIVTLAILAVLALVFIDW